MVSNFARPLPELMMAETTDHTYASTGLNWVVQKFYVINNIASWQLLNY